MAALLLVLSSCGKPPPAPAPGMAAYRAPGGRFSCQVPADWRVDEAPGRPVVTFYGPSSIALTAAFYDKSSGLGSADGYYRAQAASGAVSLSARAEAPWKGSEAYEFTARRRLANPHGPALELGEKTRLIPRAEGLLSVTVSAPPSESADAGRVLEAFLAGLTL